MLEVVVLGGIDALLEQLQAGVAVAGLAQVAALHFPEAAFIRAGALALLHLAKHVDLGAGPLGVALLLEKQSLVVGPIRLVGLAELLDELPRPIPVAFAQSHAEPLRPERILVLRVALAL